MSEAVAGETCVRNAFRGQAKSCDELGSPFTARLCRLVADRLDASSAVGERILGWRGDPTSKGDSVALRLAGALHALVLSGRSESLGASYPPNSADDETLWRAIDQAIGRNPASSSTGSPQRRRRTKCGAPAPCFPDSLR